MKSEQTRVRAAIVAIGDELLLGRTIDSNSAFIGQVLFEQGVELRGVRVVGDELDSIETAIRQAAAEADYVITTGGLGPTSDDMSRQAISRVVDKELVWNAAAMDKLEAIAKKKGRKLYDTGKRQAYFPEGASIIVNEMGTADAFTVELSKSTRLVALPGVPTEMRKLMLGSVLPWIAATSPGLESKQVAYAQCVGLSESYIGQVVEGASLPEGVSVSYRPQFPTVLITASAEVGVSSGGKPSGKPGSQQGSDSGAESAISLVKEALGSEFIFSHKPEETLSEVVGQLLRERGFQLSCAESCSGGALASLIVSAAGSSDYFQSSIVSYSNAAKESLLAVSAETLSKHGAVSEEVAIEMARGARERSGADIAVSTTGVAGPGGGSAEKPVGTVWFGLVSEAGEFGLCQQFPFSRNAFRRYCAYFALDLVRRQLLGHEIHWERR